MQPLTTREIKTTYYDAADKVTDLNTGKAAKLFVTVNADSPLAPKITNFFESKKISYSKTPTRETGEVIFSISLSDGGCLPVTATDIILNVAEASPSALRLLCLMAA